MSDHLDVNTLWPHLDPDWIIAENPHWVALNKPTEIQAPTSCERLEEPPKNDIYHRLASYLCATPHQRLQIGAEISQWRLAFDPLLGTKQRWQSASDVASGVLVVVRDLATQATLKSL